MNSVVKNQLKNPLYAARYLLNGFIWIFKKPLGHFVWIPISINLVIYSFGLIIGYLYLGKLIDWLIPQSLQWLSWLLYPLYFVSFMLVGFFSFTIIANLIAAPFYGILAEKTARLIETEPSVNISDNTVNRASWWQFLLGELNRIQYLIRWSIALIIISLIPLVNIIAPVLWAGFAAWGYALEFFAYPLENQGLIFIQQREFIGTIRYSALGFGGLILIGLSIPLVNLFIAPAAVIGATLYVHAIYSQSDKFC